MDGMNQLSMRIAKIWEQATVAGRISIIAGSITLLVSVIGVAVWSSRPDYKLLRDGISPIMSADIVSVLETNGIPNKLNYSGTGVMVPTSRWNEANVAIASITGGTAASELPGGGSGIFGGRPGHYDAVRMKESSLKKSIESMQAIKSAEVHLAIPEPSPFRKNRQTPSASVIVQAHANRTISHETATSIIHSVAKAVEGLDPKHVSLADAEGRMIGNSVHDDPARARREYIENIEVTLAMKAQDILAASLGPNRAVVRVTVDVDDFIEKLTTKNEIDSTAKVRLLERLVSSDQKGMASTNAGVAGTNANNPTVIASQTNGSQPVSGKSETTETSYDYPRTVEEVHEIGGKIVRMSISAAVDATVDSETTPPAAGAPPQLIIQQAEVERLIKSATGFDLERGDQIEVVMTKFADLPELDSGKELAEEQKWKFVSQLARNASLGITAIAALILGSSVIRKVQPITVQGSDNSQQRQLVEELSRRVDSNPEAVSKILAAWIEQQPGEESEQALNKAA